MKDTLVLEGKIYISAKRAASVADYTCDYVGQLCRAEKLDCKMIGRAWFVTESSILSHKAHSEGKILASEIPVEKKEIISVPAPVVVPNDEVKYNLGIPRYAEKPFISENLLVVSPIATPKVADEKINTAGSVDAPRSSYVDSQNDIAHEMDARELGSDVNLLPSFLPELKKYSGSVIESNLSGSVRSQNNSAKNNSLPKRDALVGRARTYRKTPIAIMFALACLVVIVARTYSSVTSFGEVALNNFSTLLPGVPTHTDSDSSANHPVLDLSTNNVDSQGASGLNGIAVAPRSDTSVGRSDSDAEIKKKIRDSFSDEVEIIPDADGSAGVIKPVFKKTTDAGFVYVLVPVKDAKLPAASVHTGQASISSP